MFNILARTKRRIKKLCEYHTRKADKYEALAKHYAEKSRQHRTASKAYMDAATTLEIETLDVSDCDWDRVLSGDLSERIAAATKRNDEHADKTGIPSPFVMKVDGEDLLYMPFHPASNSSPRQGPHDLEKRNVLK